MMDRVSKLLRLEESDCCRLTTCLESLRGVAARTMKCECWWVVFAHELEVALCLQRVRVLVNECPEVNCNLGRTRTKPHLCIPSKTRKVK